MSGEGNPEKAALVSSDSRSSDQTHEKSKLIENADSCDVSDNHTESATLQSNAGDDQTEKETSSTTTGCANFSNSSIRQNENDSENKGGTSPSATANNLESDSAPKLELSLQSQQSQHSTGSSSRENLEIAPDDVLVTQPSGMSPLCPPQLESLLDCMQVVIHKDNLRHNIDISETAIAKYEVINETRRVLFYVEKEPPPMTEQSFQYRIYDKNKQPAIEVFNPLSSTCFMCHSSWHCLKKFKFQAVIMSPPGMVAGFVRRSNTCLLQEFEILSPQEDVLLLMRGGPYDLELYSTDLDTGLGRMAVHGWHGIMHEVKRSGGDIGLTFPFDLDVRVKAILIGAVFAIDWLYSTRNGTRT